MSMAEVIESIEKDMWQELGKRIDEPHEEVDCLTLEDKPDVNPKTINTDILKDFPSTNWTLEGMIGSDLKNIKKYCSTCRHYIERDGECCNADSDYCGGFRGLDDSCEHWEGW